jgi:hypothetical protein
MSEYFRWTSRPSAGGPRIRSDKRLDLSGRAVGISISDSEDLGRLGLDPIVVDLAYTAISRHLLAHGANLAYGGDDRDECFTSILFDLIRTYDQPGQDVRGRTSNYLVLKGLSHVG